MTTTEGQVRVPDACTLPTAEQPLRLAELDDLFVTVLRGQQRLSSTTLRWELDPAAEATVRELAARESDCCSFFVFTVHPGDDVLRLEIAVPGAQADVLDALQRRAADRMRS
ncbi:hypothetical protein [Actinoplanes sp. CA-252034]|uniref:hypothetical protein n=1 Tax=Actinoplanes sp. CA-252034 TaxID=3239906 RepID=UPI003D970CB6